jgi:hypothetical protein
VIYRSITILGIGTLGGFVANAISNLDTLENLVLIDHDKVESKNLKNSIYRQIDIGESKTEALIDIIKSKNPDLTIIGMTEKYIEGKTKIPTCDLVIDCRDYTYDRRKAIDVRLYISSRYLMVDTRKSVEYKIKTEGRYISEVTKQDFRYAGSLVSMLLEKDTINQLMKAQTVQKYELDYIKHLDKNVCDIIYEGTKYDEKFINLPDKISPILKANEKYKLDVCVGSQMSPMSQLEIPKNSLKSTHDIMENLLSAVKCHDFNNFVVLLHQTNNNVILELIPETGAA